MIELVEAFDKLDENLDTQVTLEEFLKYQVHNQSGYSSELRHGFVSQFVKIGAPNPHIPNPYSPMDKKNAKIKFTNSSLQQSLYFLHWETPMSSDDLEMEKMKFELMDRDQTGTIDW